MHANNGCVCNSLLVESVYFCCPVSSYHHDVGVSCELRSTNVDAGNNLFNFHFFEALLHSCYVCVFADLIVCEVRMMIKQISVNCGHTQSAYCWRATNCTLSQGRVAFFFIVSKHSWIDKRKRIEEAVKHSQYKFNAFFLNILETIKLLLNSDRRMHIVELFLFI